MTSNEHSPAGQRLASPGHGCPVHNAEGPVLPGTGDTDYERYMRVDELLALQKPTAELAHHDELMFQITHQSWELWCKLICFELHAVARHLENDDILQAMPLLQRCTHIIKFTTDALHVMETMTPWDFHEVRRQLGNGSGAESPGFKRIMAEAPLVWPRVEALVERRQRSLVDVYTDPGKDRDLLQLLEAMTDFDMFFHIWRLNHLAMVKRVIGRDVKSLKGYAIRQLETDVEQVLWPTLWSLRNQITDLAGTSPP